MRRLAVLAVAVLIGCSPEFHREGLRRSLRAQAPSFDDAQLEAIERLRPQVRLPMRIAVSQPLSGEAWTQAEIDQIATWEQPLSRAGVARRLTVLPESLIDCGDDPCGLEAQRRAAARIGADTLLVMNPATEVDAYINVLVPLDATILGLWIVPAHHRDALTMLEGTLIDNRNQYVYAFARGDGEGRTIRPYAFAAQSDVAERSRLEALKAFGERFVTEATQLQ